MNDLDALAFAKLFKEAYIKCFGYSMVTPLSESECNLFSNEIFEKTGLIIGWKSLKNYSYYLLDIYTAKEENPSIATLDTLARYVKNAPAIDEAQRKKKENHYPYWFQFKESVYKSSKKTIPFSWKFIGIIGFAGLVIIISLFLLHIFQSAKNEQFKDDFRSVREDSLINRGWLVKSKEKDYWNRRGERSGHLTLFTLRGDNWPDSGGATGIKNLMLRKISSACFTVEVHLSDFIPNQNWQQAGLLLLEGTDFTGKSIRLSLAYNDFAGGFPNKSRDIIIQAITSPGDGLIKPEEIAHKLVFTIEHDPENLIKENLKNSALRIEKHGKTFRFLFANGSMKNSAFKEVVSCDLDIEPKYVGIFAIKGFVDDSENIPAYFDYFSFINSPCDK